MSMEEIIVDREEAQNPAAAPVPVVQEEPPTEKKQKEKRARPYGLLVALRNVLIFALVFFTIFAVASAFTPYDVVTVTSTSMEPALSIGDYWVAEKTDEDTEYQVGDIITFSVTYNETHYSRIVRRIVAISEDGIIQTRADNNPENDPFTITSSQIQSRLKWKIPV